MVHNAVHAEPVSENHIEETVRKKSLPYSDEMVRERYALEVLLLLNCPDNLGGSLFRLQYRKNFLIDAIEHSGIDEIRCYSGDSDLALHLLELDSHRLGPADHGPFAGHIDGKFRNAEHPGC